MNNKKLFTEERRNEILQIIKENKSVSVAELSKKYNVSGTTIRLDLGALEESGYIMRTHGGAVLSEESPLYEKETRIEERENTSEKTQIAQAAIQLISPKETLLLDTGTTLRSFAQNLALSGIPDLTIYSNDLSVLQTLESAELYDLHILGGKIRNGFHYTYGTQIQNELRNYHFTKLILATSSLSNGILSTSNSELASLKKTMIASAEQVILLADSSKFHHTSFQRFADLSDVHTLITDSDISETDLEIARAKVNDIIIV